MPIHYRKRFRVGPFRLNFTERGFSSWTFKVGPFSWNSRTRRRSVDLPGPLRWTEPRHRNQTTRSK